MWHKAISGDLPKDGERVLVWFEHTGYSISIYSRGEYPAGVVADTPVPCDVFHDAGGFFTDEDVYWMPLPSPPTAEECGTPAKQQATTVCQNVNDKG